MTTRDTIAGVFTRVAAEQGRKLAPISDGLKLIESGLDSLSFAIIVSSLEDTLGVDPFNSPDAIDFPVTFADFVRMYDHAVA